MDINKQVPHKIAIEIMMKSHLLLLVKATGKGSYGQIPAKFFEYIGVGTPVLLFPRHPDYLRYEHLNHFRFADSPEDISDYLYIN